MPVLVVEQKVELTFDQILSAVKQLTPEELSRLRSELLDTTWREQMETVLHRIRRGAATDPLTDAEIDAEAEAVRTARYAQSRH